MTGPLTVEYRTEDGTAHSPMHYFEHSGKLVFGPSITTQEVRVPVNQSSGTEAATFSLRVFHVGDLPSGGACGTATIQGSTPPGGGGTTISFGTADPLW